MARTVTLSETELKSWMRKAFAKGKRVGRREATAEFDALLSRHYQVKALNGTTDLFAKAWSEESHPRDDHGRFVSSRDVRTAARDPKKAEELRATVTDPDQREKLDAAIASAVVPGAKQGLARTNLAIPESHMEEGHEHTELLAGGLIRAVKDGDPDAVDAWEKKATRMAKIHWREAMNKAVAQLWADYGGGTDAQGFALNPVGPDVASVRQAFLDAEQQVVTAYGYWAQQARDILDGDGDIGTDEREQFAAGMSEVRQAYHDSQNLVWDAIEKVRDKLGGKEKGYKLGRYFKAFGGDPPGDDSDDETEPDDPDRTDLEPRPDAAAGDDPQPDGHALALAALEVAIQAREDGDDPTPALEALRAQFDTLRKAWDTSKHPRDKAGRFISKDALQDAKTDPAKADALRARVKPEDAGKLEAVLSGQEDPGRTRRGQARHDAKTRAANRQANREKAHDVLDRIAQRGEVTRDELHALADHLPALTVAELRVHRRNLQTTFGGARVKQGMVDALAAHALGKLVPRTAPPATNTVYEAVRKLGGLDPNSLAFKGVYDGLKEAMQDGVSLGVFRRGGRGLDQLAQELAGSGLISVPDDAHPGEHLLGLLRQSAYTHAADATKQYEDALDEHYRLLQAEHDAADRPAVEEAVRLGEAAGRAEGEEGGGREGGEDAGTGTGEVDDSFDFGANAAEPAPPRESPGDRIDRELTPADRRDLEAPDRPTPGDRTEYVDTGDHAAEKYDAARDKADRMQAWESAKPGSVAAQEASRRAQERLAGAKTRQPGDKLAGGRADAAPATAFPPAKVAEGAAVESEHTADPATAAEIARDHLAEDPDYYAKLKRVEGGTEPGSGVNKPGGDLPKPGGGVNKPAPDNPADGSNVKPVELTRDEVANLLANPGDRYVDVGHKKDELKGQHPVSGDPRYGYSYAPEHFVRSDATGRMVRHYVKLPNGQTVHPDELRDAISRGRVTIKQSEGEKAHGEKVKTWRTAIRSSHQFTRKQLTDIALSARVTPAERSEVLREHAADVAKQLENDGHVPPEVLADYPDLAAKHAT